MQPLRHGCAGRLERSLAVVALAIALVVPAEPALAANEGAVELGLDVQGSFQVPGPGEDASIDLGLDLALARIEGDIVPGDAGTVDLGLDVAYDRVIENDYTIKLDPNNGTAASVFKGSVAPSRLSASKDVEYDKAYDAGALGSYEGGKPDGVSLEAIASVKAVRPGYKLVGWYWADASAPRDAWGRVVLGAGPVDLKLFEDYDLVREHAGKTLYAKWELADEDVVRLHLTDARNDGVADVNLWFWQGWGYTYERPVADCEADPAFTIIARAADAPATLPLVIGQRPDPPASTQYFAGWGFEDSSSGALESRYLVTATTKENDAGARKTEYAFGDWAFNQDYVRVQDGNLVWVGPMQEDDTVGAPEGQLLSTLAALFKTAKINVSAPFQVTFTKDRMISGDHVPYAADDLAWTGDKTDEWVMSAEQSFTNKGDTDVWVSRIECTDAGASSLFANASKGISMFSLGTSNVQPDQGKSVFFGVAGGSRDVSVDSGFPERRIVLKNKAGDNATKLYFGLNIHEAGFDEAAVVLGSEAGSSYAAGLANVKYTYSVAD